MAEEGSSLFLEQPLQQEAKNIEGIWHQGLLGAGCGEEASQPSQS